MMHNLHELRWQYEALWENYSPLDEIVDFCRRLAVARTEVDFSRRLAVARTEMDSPLAQILQNSTKWGDMALRPFFLKYVRDDDDGLMQAVGQYLRNLNDQRFFMAAARILSEREIVPDRVRAFFWTIMIQKFWPYYRLISDGCEDISLVDNMSICLALVKRKKPGHELVPKGLVFLNGKSRLTLSGKIKQALEEDSHSLFELSLTLSQKLLQNSSPRKKRSPLQALEPSISENVPPEPAGIRRLVKR